MKIETALTCLLWKEIGGTLYEDYPLAIRGRKDANVSVFSTIEALAAVKLVDRHHLPHGVEGYIVCLQEDEVLRAVLRAEYPFLHLRVYGQDDLRALAP